MEYQFMANGLAAGFVLTPYGNDCDGRVSTAAAPYHQKMKERERMELPQYAVDRVNASEVVADDPLQEMH
jgi:hypothetical protein